MEDLSNSRSNDNTVQEETTDAFQRDVAASEQTPKPGQPVAHTAANEGTVLYSLTMKNYVYVPPVQVGAYYRLIRPPSMICIRTA